MEPDCVTLWIGSSLGPVERACLRSVIRQGHRLALYCYRASTGIPDGVEVRDASEILPLDLPTAAGSGQVAMFSDRFRYELQRRGLGTWVDADVYLLAALDGGRPHLFGEQAPKIINNAVLRIPQDSPMLRDLMTPFDGEIPAWLPHHHRLRSKLRKMLTGKTDLTRMPWGVTGPAALTAIARSHGLDSQALDSAILYPVPWQKADWIRDPAIQLEQVIQSETVAIHLWNQCIRHFKNDLAPPGSFLSRLHQEGAE